MSKKKNNNNRLTVDYHHLGTLSELQLIEAIIDDIKMIEEDYGVRFYSNARLVVWASNEYGDTRSFVRHCGEPVSRLDSTHYRPACLDYDL